MSEIWLETIPRVVLALFFLTAVADGYWWIFTGRNLVHPPTTERVLALEKALKDVRFFWPFSKTVDLIGALLLLTNIAPAFGLALLAPVMSVVVLIIFFLNPKAIPLALLMIVCGGLLAYSYADRYAAMFQ